MSNIVSIRELKQGASRDPKPALVHVQLDRNKARSTKNGDPYYELHFADAESSLVLRVWNSTPMFDSVSQLQDGVFYELSGDFCVGNDGRSIDSRQWQARPLSESEIELLLSGSAELKGIQQKHFDFIVATVAKVEDPRLNHLATALLETWGDRLQRTAAARDYHHARRGGLVEHVGQMMRAAVNICDAYPMLNRDLLVTGVLFHDIGKLWENVYAEQGFSMPYTEVSELIGHIPLGMEIVNKLWRDTISDPSHAEWKKLEPSNERVRLHLLHLIVAHHGELAFGSPVVPKTPEAQALHYIDNLDAKMEMFEKGYEVAQELGKNVYQRVRPLPSKLVKPLEKCSGPSATDDPEGEPF